MYTYELTFNILTIHYILLYYVLFSISSISIIDSRRLRLVLVPRFILYLLSKYDFDGDSVSNIYF